MGDLAMYDADVSVSYGVYSGSAVMLVSKRNNSGPTQCPDADPRPSKHTRGGPLENDEDEAYFVGGPFLGTAISPAGAGGMRRERHILADKPPIGYCRG